MIKKDYSSSISYVEDNKTLLYDAEMTLIGMIVTEPEKQELIIKQLKVEYFENEDTKRIYKEILRLREEEKMSISSKYLYNRTVCDVQLGKSVLKLSDVCDLASKGDLFELRNKYISLIKKNYLNKKIRTEISCIKGVDVEDNLEHIISLCSELSDDVKDIDETKCFNDVYRDNKKKAIAIAKGEIKSSVLFSGYLYLDYMTQGWTDGELIIIGARSGMGKTRFVSSLIDSISKCKENADKSCYFFSLEESSEKVVNMISSKNTKINSKHFKRYNLGDRLEEYIKDDTMIDLYINDNRDGMTIGKIRSTVELYSKSYGVKNFFVDTINSIKRKSGVDEKSSLDEYSRELKSIAVAFGVRIFALAQLNRSSETRTGKDKKPMKSDFKGSDEILHHADSALSLFNEEYYDRQRLKDDKEQEVYKDYKYWVSVMKTRDGLEWSIAYNYDLGYCEFREIPDSNIEYLINFEDQEMRMSKWKN